MEDNFGIIAWLLLPVNSTQGKYGLLNKTITFEWDFIPLKIMIDYEGYFANYGKGIKNENNL